MIVNNWQPGEQGKGIVDQQGRVHTFNEEDYETHGAYIDSQTNIRPAAFFYIEPDGGIDLTYPSLYEEPKKHELMLDHICEADPHFHEYHDPDAEWSFGAR